MVSITGLLVADGLGTVLPVVLLLVLVSLCRGWVWAADLRRSRRVAATCDVVRLDVAEAGRHLAHSLCVRLRLDRPMPEVRFAARVSE